MGGNAFGISGRERLLKKGGIIKVPVAEIDIFVLRNFLDASECEELIGLIDANCKPSRLFSSNPDKEFRTSETCNLDPKHELVRRLDERLTDLTGIDPGYGEFAQGQRYTVGQQFKPHHDYLNTASAYWPEQQQNGGQRTWTTMIFLNEPEQGGETYFPSIDLKLPPRPGSLVAWYNLDDEGKPNAATIHQGMPVVAGLKYIVTKWYRERPWAAKQRGL